MQINYYDIIKIIEEEPEYPGEMPDNLKRHIMIALARPEDKRFDFFVKAMRFAVKETKNSILVKLANHVIENK